jgi:hypothetical protein
MAELELPQLALPQGQIRRWPFPTVAAAELESFLSGETCSVLETRRFYQFDANSAEVRDGIRVLAPAGGGRLLMIAPVMTDAEVAAAIRIATASQSGLMSAAQADKIQGITIDSNSNIGITSSGQSIYLISHYLSGFDTLILGSGGISGSTYFRSSGDNNSVINVQIRIKDSTGALQDGIGFFPTWVNSTPGNYSVSTAVGALGKTAFTLKSTSTAALIEFNGDVETGNIKTSGNIIVDYDTFTSDATLTSSSKSCSVVNPSGLGMILTMHFSLPDGILQTIVNASSFAVTLGRNSQKIAGLESNYTLPANTSVTLQYFGATLGWLIISNG